MHVTVKEVKKKERKEKRERKEPSLTEYKRGHWSIMNQRKRNAFVILLFEL